MIILKDQKMHNRAKVEEHLSLTVNKFNIGYHLPGST